MSRGPHHATEAPAICAIGSAVSHSLSLTPRSSNTITLSTLLSLTATVHKLLMLVVLPETGRAANARQQSWAGEPSLQREWYVQRASTMQAIDAYVPTLVRAIASLSGLHMSDCGGSNSRDATASTSSSGSTVDDNSSSNKDTKGPGGGSGSGASRGSSTSGSGGCCDSSQNDSSPKSKGPVSGTVLIHQLQACMVLTLVAIRRWRMEMNSGYGPGWLADARQACEQLPWVGLKALVTPVMRAAKNVLPGTELGALWERYVVIHFNGRLTPGCCHRGCINLDGCSESALGTQLCGRCRRARYCCVGCQRAAWLERGHSSVCGT